MSEQPGNIIPTAPKPAPEVKRPANIENPIEYNDPSSSGKGEDGGALPWQSHPHPENTFLDSQALQSKLPTSVEYGGDGNPTGKSTESVRQKTQPGNTGHSGLPH